jgi:hypothetical protein
MIAIKKCVAYQRKSSLYDRCTLFLCRKQDAKQGGFKITDILHK